MKSAHKLVRVAWARCADRLLDALTSYRAPLTGPEEQQRIQALLDRGLQREVHDLYRLLYSEAKLADWMPHGGWLPFQQFFRQLLGSFLLKIIACTLDASDTQVTAAGLR